MPRRSCMNIPFQLRDKNMDPVFISEAADNGLFEFEWVPHCWQYASEYL
jgi:phosphoserine aminotransferase